MRESYGKKFRTRAPANVIDEMEYLIKLGANIIIFDDDNFTTSENHIRGICEEIKKRNLHIKWVAHSRVDEVNPSLLKLMKDAGCTLLRFGVESGSEKIIKILGKTNDARDWLRKCREVIRQAKSLGISVACLFIVGSPEETYKDFISSIEFSKSLSPDIVQIAYFVAFPGSKIYQQSKEKCGVDSLDIYHYGLPSSNLSKMSSDELKRAQSLFYRSFLIRPRFLIKHFFDYGYFYIKNPEIFLKLSRITKQIGV
jgi:anaerobic magnesium-protoporphyrin IX monomethyl ester cyclase